MDFRLFLFLLNFLLILIDATLGSRTVPTLLQRLGDDALNLPVSAILAGAVTLYTFFNCLGYFRNSMTILVVVMLLVAAELAAQLILKRQVAGPDK